MATIYKTAVSGDIVGANASVYGGARNLLSRAKRLAGQRMNDLAEIYTHCSGSINFIRVERSN
jgi:hypothetical protein